MLRERLAAGEVVLGYPNDYGLYTTRPLIEPHNESFASLLPNAEDEPLLKDFGRNGSYLVIRQLHQDVPGFWQFLDRESGSVPEKRERLATISSKFAKVRILKFIHIILTELLQMWYLIL